MQWMNLKENFTLKSNENETKKIQFDSLRFFYVYIILHYFHPNWLLVISSRSDSKIEIIDQIHHIFTCIDWYDHLLSLLSS